MAAYTEKKTSDQNNRDAGLQISGFEKSGVLLNSKNPRISFQLMKLSKLGKQNQVAYDKAKKAQATPGRRNTMNFNLKTSGQKGTQRSSLASPQRCGSKS